MAWYINDEMPLSRLPNSPPTAILSKTSTPAAPPGSFSTKSTKSANTSPASMSSAPTPTQSQPPHQPAPWTGRNAPPKASSAPTPSGWCHRSSTGQPTGRATATPKKISPPAEPQPWPKCAPWPGVVVGGRQWQSSTRVRLGAWQDHPPTAAAPAPRSRRSLDKRWTSQTGRR